MPCGAMNGPMIANKTKNITIPAPTSDTLLFLKLRQPSSHGPTALSGMGAASFFISIAPVIIATPFYLYLIRGSTTVYSKSTIKLIMMKINATIKIPD